MIKDAERIPNFNIIRFEDLLENPHDTFQKICDASQLDVSAITQIRLENKPTISASGSHEYVEEHSRENIIWHPVEQFEKHFKGNVNQNQINRLSTEQKAMIQDVAGNALRNFGYI